MAGPVVRTVLRDIRSNWPHLETAEALRSFVTARVMAAERGLPEAMAVEIAMRSVAAARADFDVPLRVARAPAWLRSIRVAYGRVGFVSRLVTPEARAFLEWAVARAGPDGVLHNGSLAHGELERWLRNLTIMRRDPDSGVFRYRRYGPEHCEIVGRDLTGSTLAVWPARVARIKGARLHTLVRRQVPVLVHSATMRYEDGVRRRGTRVIEQLLWPIRHGDGPPDAVIDLSVLVPDCRLTADMLRSEGHRLARDFVADGAPVEQAPRIAC